MLEVFTSVYHITATKEFSGTVSRSYMATYMGSSQRTACCSETIFRTVAFWKILQFFIRSRTRGKTTLRFTVTHCLINSQHRHIINDVLQAHVFETELKCVAFLVNFDKHQTPTVAFRNMSFQLAPKSISILSDCRTVVFETAKVYDLLTYIT
jgi:hypothetical protein